MGIVIAISLAAQAANEGCLHSCFMGTGNGCLSDSPDTLSRHRKHKQISSKYQAQLEVMWREHVVPGTGNFAAWQAAGASPRQWLSLDGLSQEELYWRKRNRGRSKPMEA